MSKKYRLVRTAPGVLDLSQVLDDQGRPVLLRALSDYAVVDAGTAQHPLVTRFVGAGLAIEEISPTPAAGPAIPVPVPTVPKTIVTPAPAPAPTPEPRVIIPEPEPEPPPPPPPAAEETKPENAPTADTIVDEPVTSTKKSRKHGR
jgi:hypothetical protein